ncbi:aminotransferase class I/II-fold pyridoxal phosphate-dependent enzyme, partial [Candidatus Neomarinimicrobiota bacterium]
EGMKCLNPMGAFYVFPNVQALPKSSKELEEYFLEEYSVASLAGTSFGSYGEGYLRFSYANSVENIRKALDRIAEGVAKL